MNTDEIKINPFIDIIQNSTGQDRLEAINVLNSDPHYYTIKQISLMSGYSEQYLYNWMSNYKKNNSNVSSNVRSNVSKSTLPSFNDVVAYVRKNTDHVYYDYWTRMVKRNSGEKELIIDNQSILIKFLETIRDMEELN